MKISIITPVYGHADITSQFIASTTQYMDDDSELIIIDNNSPDNTLPVLATAKKLYPTKNIKIFSHNKNVGFGGANNIGAKFSKADNLLFISNDVQILGDFISPVVEFLEKDGHAICGPNLLAHDTGWNTFKDVGTIPYIEGFCMGIPKIWFDMVEGFDENFFLDMEDIDLCFRLRLAGVALAQINLPIMHTLGGSFDQLSKHRSEITAQSVQYFKSKWNLSRG